MSSAMVFLDASQFGRTLFLLAALGLIQRGTKRFYLGTECLGEGPVTRSGTLVGETRSALSIRDTGLVIRDLCRDFFPDAVCAHSRDRRIRNQFLVVHRRSAADIGPQLVSTELVSLGCNDDERLILGLQP